MVRKNWLCGFLLVCLGAPALADSPLEYRIKTAFLYNLARMVDWPGAGVLSVHQPFTICFIGEEPFGDALLGLAEKQVDKRPIALQTHIVLGQVQDCEMLYIGASEDGRLEAVLAEVAKQPILTIADHPGFGHRGVIANLLRVEQKIQLEFNREAAEKAKLTPSPTLLKLALTPRPRE